MKKLCCLCLLIASQGLAAVPEKIDTKSINMPAEEILTLPEHSRTMLLQAQAEKFYPQMIAIAFSPKQSVEMRWKALTAAAQIKKQNSVTDLKKALNSPDWFMRNAALLSLNSVSSKEGRKAAETLLVDKALVVRSAAVEVLGPMMDTEIRDLFWQELDAEYNFRKNQSLWIREQLLGYLAKNPLKTEKSQFLKLTESPARGIKTAAVDALKKIN